MKLEFVPIYCEKICKKGDPVVSKKLVMFVPLTHPRHSKISESQNLLGLGCVSGTNMTLSRITFYAREKGLNF